MSVDSIYDVTAFKDTPLYDVLPPSHYIRRKVERPKNAFNSLYNTASLMYVCVERARLIL
jgi:hypothetical protein